MAAKLVQLLFHPPQSKEDIIVQYIFHLIVFVAFFSFI